MLGTVVVFLLAALIVTFFTDLFSFRKGATFWRVMFFIVSILVLAAWYFAAKP